MYYARNPSDRDALPEPSGHHSYLSQRYFGSLNGLRCLCIAAVFWHHSPANGITASPRLLERGFVGVDFFFVLSGFLITTLLLREEREARRISLPAFYWRRALRILPAYFLLVTLMSAYWIGVAEQRDLLGFVPYYYGFLANFLKGDIPLLSITWSLSVEEQYYLIWPALLVMLPLAARGRAALLVGLLLLCLLAMLGLAEWLDLPRLETAHAVFVLPGMSYMAILVGSLLAVLLHSPRCFQALSKVCATRYAPLIMFALLLSYLQWAPVGLTGWPALGMDVLMALCVASLVMREDHLVRPILNFRPIARVGEISYGLYLYHLIGLHIAHLLVQKINLGETAHDTLVSVVFPVVSLVIAEISFRYYERPFLTLKDGLSMRSRSLRKS